MTDRARRRQLRDAALAHPPDAGVYAIRHLATGRSVIASTVNLAGARNRYDFAVTTGSLAALDGQLVGDIRAHGPAGLRFEVLEVVPVDPGTAAEELRADLRTLETLWREKLDDPGC